MESRGTFNPGITRPRAKPFSTVKVHGWRSHTECFSKPASASRSRNCPRQSQQQNSGGELGVHVFTSRRIVSRDMHVNFCDAGFKTKTMVGHGAPRRFAGAIHTIQKTCLNHLSGTCLLFDGSTDGHEQGSAGADISGQQRSGPSLH